MKTSEGRLQDLSSYLENLPHTRADEIPDINLYMDQVTTFMDSHLKDIRRHPCDKVPAKAMINNYTENSLLPPPVKKKYSGDHILMSVFMYYFKNLLSFSDIEELLRPITSKYFSRQTSRPFLEDIYNEILILERGEMNNLRSDVAAKSAQAWDISSDVPVNDEDRECLGLFVFICELSFNVRLKIQVIEMIADQLKEDAPVPRKKQAS